MSCVHVPRGRYFCIQSIKEKKDRLVVQTDARQMCASKLVGQVKAVVHTFHEFRYGSSFFIFWCTWLSITYNAAWPIVSTIFSNASISISPLCRSPYSDLLISFPTQYSQLSCDLAHCCHVDSRSGIIRNTY